MPEEKKLKTNEFYLIGIGSSAGGIEALSILVKNLPKDLNCAYVIAQHLSPNYKSILHEILNRESQLLVKKITNNEKPKKNTVYVIPPNKNLIIQDKVFVLKEPTKEIFTKPSINVLFESMAREYGENAIGIILSGTGNDGSKGLVSIKANGGITFAQIPKTAKYDGMPNSAIDSGSVDYQITPDEFGNIIKRYLSSNHEIAPIINTKDSSDEFQILLKSVKKKTGIDFTNYKQATVLRRLQRRLATVECSSLTEYLEYVNSHEQELDLFAKDTLISVTSFFRDSEAFDIFKKYIQELVYGKKDGDEIRIWVAGCATGEEAYSIGIIFLEEMRKQEKTCKLQIFATDIDMNALTIARQGLYHESSMGEMNSIYIDKYFIHKNNTYEVKKVLRDCVIFAKQDLTYDPPFLKLDLVTCRNVLIYFNNELQSKVISMFHYSLNEKGILFLGRSESIGVNSDSFISLDSKTRVFKKDPTVVLNTKKKVSRAYIRNTIENPTMQKAWEKLLQDEIASYYQNAAVLVDADLNIIHTFGQVSNFITFPAGSPKYNLHELIIEAFRLEIVPIFNVVKKTKELRKSKDKVIESLDNRIFRLVIRPTENAKHETYIVLFEHICQDDSQKDSTTNKAFHEELLNKYDYENEDRLVSQEHLQSLIEELSTSNEEMQALNEEIQASNEEMQATNEELEASNEELQATNEELASVNEELLVKTNELAVTNFEFESVYNTLDFPLIVFDMNLALKRFNTTAGILYDLGYASLGQSLENTSLPNYLKQKEKYFLEAINARKKNHIIISHEKNTFKLFITPSMNKSGKVISLVIAIVDNTDILEAKKQLEEKQEMILSIMNNSLDIIALKDVAGRYEFVNSRFEEFFGLKNKAILNKSDMALFPKEIAKTFREDDLAVIRDMIPKESTKNISFKGKSYWLATKRFPIFDEDGLVKAICIEIQDITHKYEAEKNLKLAAKVYDRAGEGILITDENNKILTVNNSFTRITGYEPSEIIGKSPAILKSDLQSDEFYKHMWATINERGWWQGEINNKKKSGEVYPEWLTINTVYDSDGKITNYVAIFSDISLIKNTQRQIEHMATHDELTHLANRFSFVDKVKHNIAKSGKSKKKFAVLFIDLDEFKNINDTLGHNVGDALLIEVANRLKELTKVEDFVARLGGDEFVVILHTDDEKEIIDYAEKVLDYISASYNINDGKLYISCSIGISVFPKDGQDSSSLLRSADTAMYKAKEKGKNRYIFFESQMKALSLQRMSIESGLRIAIEKNLFSLVFQPKVNMEDNKIIGAEVLLRWNDPHLGFISPDIFIPIAETSGLMIDIGKWVINETLMHIKKMQDEKLLVPQIAINISAVQFKDPDCETCVIETMEKYNIDPTQIKLELTEGILMENTDKILESLNSINKKGIQISIDDFGTGYSSLAYLKKFPLSELKIDRSFVDDIDQDSNDYHIAKAIINIAEALNLDVIAEGVETVEQKNMLLDLGCKKAQGFLFHRPLEIKEFKKLLPKAKNAK